MRWCAHFPEACGGRLEIARGLVHSPKILFLDEPTTGLDPVSRTNVWQLIRNLCERSDLTILLTTHYMDEADKLCDRIAIVDHGKLAALDTPTKLKDSVPGNDTVEAEFAGRAGGLERSAAQAGAGRGRDAARRHGAHLFARRSSDGGGSDGFGAGAQRAGEASNRAKHHA